MSETLMAAAIFSRYMMESMDLSDARNLPTVGQAIFGESMGNGGGTYYFPNGEIVEIDVLKGAYMTAVPVRRGMAARPANKPFHDSGRFTSLARTFPLLIEEGMVTADQLTKRTAGENPYQPRGAMERARWHAAHTFASQIRSICFWQEVAAWEMLKTGKMSLIYGTSSSDEQIDTKRAAGNTLSTVAASWASASTSIIASMDTHCEAMLTSAYVVPDVMIVGDSIPGYIAANTEILALGNIKSAGTAGFSVVYFGDNYKPAAKYQYLIDQGLKPLCRIITKKGRELNVFRYDGRFPAPSTGTETAFLTANQVLYFNSSARGDRYIGPPERLSPTIQDMRDWDELFGFSPENIQVPPFDGRPGVIDPQSFYCSVSRDKDNRGYILNAQAAPIYVTRDTDKFVFVSDVTAT